MISIQSAKYESRFAVVLLMVLVAIGPACQGDTIITPFSDRDAHFTLFGFISTADTQRVRVIPVRTQLDREMEPVPLDVTVTTTGKSSGLVEEWGELRPLLSSGERGVMFDDSTFGHVFQAIFTPVIGETYVLEVAGRDGRSSSASVSIPVVEAPVISDVWERNDSLFQSVTWPGVDQPPFDIEMVYRLGSSLFFPEIQLPAIPVDYNGKGFPTPGGWQVDIDLQSDVAFVRQFVADNFSDYSPLPSVEDVDTYELVSMDVRMRIIVMDSLSQQFSGDVSIAALSQPGAFSNVENGFGFLAAVGTNSRLWELPPDPEIRERIGFTR
ncbi:MAG: hypothetical protein HKN43_15145 [Rhodothermales bacterium]|nr:hypothetical protein [Rhodothermales bacterium]